MNKKHLIILLLTSTLFGCNINNKKQSSTETLNSMSSSSFNVWGEDYSENTSSSLNESTSSISDISSSSVEDSSSENDSSSSIEESSTIESSSSVLTQGQYEAPENGYAIFITPANGGDSYYFVLNSIPEKDNADRDQFFGDNVVLNKGDIFKMYNCSSDTFWTNIVIEEYGSYLNFQNTNNGVKVLVSGTYDIYAKLKFEDDVLYIGNQDGQ